MDTESKIIHFMGSNKYIITKIKCWPVFKQEALTLSWAAAALLRISRNLFTLVHEQGGLFSLIQGNGVPCDVITRLSCSVLRASRLF